MPKTPNRSGRVFYWLAVVIILFGVALRLMILLKNNCLFIDEVNVALNVYDRNMLQLFTPLDNNQYAPPGFLVVVKLLSVTFGYSEYVFRLYTFLSGIAALFLMLAILKKYVSLNVLWYPLCMMAVGFVYIKYSVFVKQYSPDIVITLSLILLALKYSILVTPARKFVTVWMLAGVIAIWFSMPSVFVLASIGLCYFIVVLKNKEYQRLVALALIGMFWLLNFVVYYNILLKYQIADDYLQWWHQSYFLFPFPANAEEWEQNWRVTRNLFTSLGGKWALSIAFHISMMFVGAVYLLRKNVFKGLLIILPILLCLIAVCMRKYTMIDRVMLFTFPLILLLIATGIQAIFNLKNKIVNALVIACCIICIVNFSELDKLPARSETEEITRNLDFAVKWGVKGGNLYIHAFAVSAARYYIEIHPAKERYITLRNPHYLKYEADFDRIGSQMKERSAMLYSYENWDIILKQIGQIEKHMTTIGMNGLSCGWISIFERKKN